MFGFRSSSGGINDSENDPRDGGDDDDDDESIDGSGRVEYLRRPSLSSNRTITEQEEQSSWRRHYKSIVYYF